MNKLKRTLFFVVISGTLLMIFVLLFTMLSCEKIETTEKYKDYIQADFHLTYLQGEDIYYRSNTESNVRYRKIKNVSSDEYIIYSKSHFLSRPLILLYKNPTYLKEPINDYTIKSIQFYADNYSRDINELGKQDILYEITDDEIIKKIKKTISKETSYIEYDADKWSSLFIKQDNEKRDFYLRITFEENDNLVWDALIYSCGDNHIININSIDTEIIGYSLDPIFNEYIENIIDKYD